MLKIFGNPWQIFLISSPKKNQKLLATRAQFQKQIDAWHLDKKPAFYPAF